MPKTSNKAQNILFIMCDQLRQDYLSCYGHPTLATPNIDALAARGVRFDNAYCQAPLCGPSRASFYTGRYQSSHGVMANVDNIRLDEMTIGEYLKPLGYRSVLIGKADVRKSAEDMVKLGLDLDSDYAQAAMNGGFEPYEVHQGIYPDALLPENHGYTSYLKHQGYPGKNPWNSAANSGVDADGKVYDGWLLRNSGFRAGVAQEHSETAFTTNRAIEFIDQQSTSDQPWCMHLSYIKPHWPLIAPAPYHNMFSAKDIPPANKSEQELDNPHPVYQAFMQQEYSQSYAREDVRDCTIPTYMGLIKQVDDQLGRLFKHLEDKNLLADTLIVFTADHGDYLGDHWLGEKDLFHDASVKIPMIVVDPNSRADATRGTFSDALVEAIDVLPSLVEFAGGEVCRERVEGRSLLPLLDNSEIQWRDFAVSEIDYSDRGARGILQVEPYQCRAIMIRDKRWKFTHYHLFRAQLFDLENDPNELIDLGESDQSEHRQIREQMFRRLLDWQRQRKHRTGISYGELADMGPEADEELGIIIGRW